MKITISSVSLLLISATNAQFDRMLRNNGNNYRSSYGYSYSAPAAAATCDSTIGHCQEEICDIVSYSCAVSGPAGPPGLPGQHGQKGPAGLDGKNGYDGKQGPMGPPGPQGYPGEKGTAGAPGAQGLHGEVGLPGKPGRDGLDGLTGAPGADGRMGPRGPKGDKGEKGGMGRQGPPGPAGAAAAQLDVDHVCVSQSSGSVAVGSCSNGLDGGAVASCPQGHEMTSCNGVSPDKSPLAVSCYIEGNRCICDGCDFFGDNKKYHYPKMIAQARCCRVSAGGADAKLGPWY